MFAWFIGYGEEEVDSMKMRQKYGVDLKAIQILMNVYAAILIFSLFDAAPV